jgi:hypothetical protein
MRSLRPIALVRATSQRSKRRGGGEASLGCPEGKLAQQLRVALTVIVVRQHRHARWHV